MSRPEIFLSDSRTHDWQSKVSTLLDISARLPGMVFKLKTVASFFFEFDFMLQPDFWPTIKLLTQAASDTEATVCVVDPDPFHYYYAHFGYCNAFALNANADRMEYFSALAHEPVSSPADAILYNSDIIAWASDSLTWAAWGERDKGIGVLAVKEASLMTSLDGRLDGMIPTTTAERLLSCSLGHAADNATAKGLLSNYE